MSYSVDDEQKRIQSSITESPAAGERTDSDKRKAFEKSIVRVAIVGTAGRGDDAGKVDGALFAKMTEYARHVIVDVWKLSMANVHLVSGGAAVTDHVAVALFLQPKSTWHGLTLHLPCSWNERKARADESCDNGCTMNSYHDEWAEQLGRSTLAEIGITRSTLAEIGITRSTLPEIGITRSTLAEIEIARSKGAQLTVSSGFLARNRRIAAEAQYMLAFTWSDTDAPKQHSGTSYTWSAAAAGRVRKLHVPLGTLSCAAIGERDTASTH